MSNNKNTPPLRFPEFSGEWEEAIIDDFFDFKNGLNKEKEFFGQGTPIINFKDVYKLTSIKESDIKGLVTLTNNEIERFSAKKGDIFFTRTSETIDDIGMSATLIEDIQNCVFSGFTLRARPREYSIFDSLFTSYCFNINSIRKEIVTKSSFTTRALTSGTLLKKVVFHFPKIEEQQKIANFLTAIDEKINQLTQKKAALDQYKKGVMQQIFNQTIRFKKDDGSAFEDWEVRKLGDFLTFKNGVNASKEQYGQGFKFINVLDIINNNVITFNKIKGSVDISKSIFLKNEVKYGDILFQRSSETREEVGQANVYLDKDKSATFGGFVIRGQSIRKYNPLFMNYVLKSSSVRKEITSRSGGSTRFNIGQESLKKVKISIPSLEEQQKIANFLTLLDQKIEKTNHQLEKAQAYKKGLLQQMFV
jgi:type I restriction enzyme S subunit